MYRFSEDFRKFHQGEHERNAFSALRSYTIKTKFNSLCCEEKEENNAETEVVANDDSSQASKSDDNFGLIIRDERDSIQSRILGEFKGWDGYTKFNLENGQVWQQSSAGVLRVIISNPSITIKRSRVSDTYMLKVEGLNSSVRVKRVE